MAKEPEKVTPVTDPTEEPASAADVPQDDDKALDSFLNREASPQKARKSTDNRFNRNMIILFSAVLVIAVLVGVIIFLNTRPYKEGTSTEGIYDEAWTIATVDEAGMHTVDVPVDENGEPRQNGVGTLIDYTPSGISAIRVSNESGAFTILAHTHSGEATEYQLEGYSDFSLQTGMPDNVANDAGNLNFLTIAGIGKNLADYGLDAPRATVNISFTDGTGALILIGNEAVASTGTYLSFGGTDTVYLVENESVDAFFYSLTDFISLTITDSPDTTDNAQLRRATISGSHYAEPIVLEPNNDAAVDYYYRVTSPREMFADAVKGNDITGAIRDLYAEEVAAVSPSSDTASFLSTYGLGDGCYAQISAEYPDATIRLRASAPDSTGTVYLANLADSRVIYRIQVGAVSWVSTSLSELIPDTILNVSRTALTNITLTAGAKTASIDVDTRTQTVANTSGDTEEVTTTEAYYDDKMLSDDSFTILLQNLKGLPYTGAADTAAGEKLLEIRYTYSTGRAADTVVIYNGDDKNVAVTVNGKVVGTTKKAYANTLVANLSDIIAGKLPVSI